MKTKLFLYVFLALALVMSVSAVGSVNIVAANLSVSGAPGAINSTQYFDVQNTGGSLLNNIIINATGLTGATGTIPSSSMEFVPPTLNLAAGGTSPVALIWHVPSSQRAGTYTGTAFAVYNTTNQDSISVIATVSAVPSYSAVSTSPSIVQGSSGTLTVNVTNTGNMDLMGINYRITDPFTSGGNTLDVTSAPVGSINVPYGSSNTFNIAFNPPALQAAGTYSGIVNLTYDTTLITLPLTVTVVPINKQLTGSATNGGVTILRASSTVLGRTAGVLTLNNTGNAALTGVTISATDLTGPGMISAAALSVSENGFSMALGAGKTTYITPNGVPGSAASGTYTGTLQISYGGVSTLSVPFSLVVSDAVASIAMSDVIYAQSDRNVNVSTTVTVTNNGAFQLNGITLTATAPNTWITGVVPASLPVGGSFAVNIMSTVPEDAGGGLYKIGTLAFRSLEHNKTVDIKTNARTMLEFDSVKVSIDGASWDNVNSGGTADDDARPGSTFGVKVKIENLFTDDTENDMSDVEVTAVFKNAGEDGDDIEGDSETFDIDAGDKSEEIELEFDDDVIDWDADAGKLVMELWAEGEDEEGSTHKAFFNFTINVKRESKSDFIITRLDAPSSAVCGRPFTLYVDGRSVGEDSDNEVILKITSSELGLNQEKRFEMGAYDGDDCDALDGDDDCINFNYQASVGVPSALAGEYRITAKVYRDNGGDVTDEKDVTVNVQCSGIPSDSSSSDDDDDDDWTGSTSGSTGSTTGTTGTTSRPSASTTPSTTTSSVDVMYGGSTGASYSRGVTATMPTRMTDTTKKSGFTDSEGYLALLSILSVLAIIGIVVLLVWAFSKPVQKQ
jgi:uncharacterized membrane protein